MRLKSVVLNCCILAIAAHLPAQSITGTIVIKRKLTKPNVTPSVSLYQRGTTIELGKDPDQDPIAYERSRVVIYLEGPLSGAQATVDSAALQVEQLNRRFVPDLVVVPAGSTISFPNMDPIFHNIYSLSKPKSFDLGNYDKGRTRKVTFPKPGIVEIYCHLHPNMQATVVITPNHWFARPDRNGQYRIPQVPPGQYTLVAWHKSAGFFRKAIVIDNERDTTADFFIPLDVDPRQEAERPRELDHTAGSR
ncbi:MAG TPA: carboxypeptidase regulatory-like domain-containing protein [Terracidiphilus sp.]|nr:carboxypeptidase regulatory-like domain-containing protein [Terracidiphilus sp.]